MVVVCDWGDEEGAARERRGVAEVVPPVGAGACVDPEVDPDPEVPRLPEEGQDTTDDLDGVVHRGPPDVVDGALGEGEGRGNLQAERAEAEEGRKVELPRELPKHLGDPPG